MTAYILLLSFLLFVYFYSLFKRDVMNTNKIPVMSFVVFIVLWLMSGLRYQVGADFTSYESYFNRIDLYSWSYPLYEKCYYLLNYVVGLFTDNSQYIFLVTSFIVIYLINKRLYELSVSYALSIFLFVTLFFYFNSMNLVRQYLAIAIFFYAIKYIINSDFKKYAILVIIAGVFHQTALLMLPFYWIFRKRFSFIFYVTLIPISFVLSFVTPTLIGIVARLFPKYETYADYSFEGSSANSIILITFVVFWFAYLNISKISKLDKNSIIYMNAVFFALVFAILSSQNIIIFRISMYFYLFILLLIPLCMKIFDKWLKPIVMMAILSLMSVYLLYMLNGNVGLHPYTINLSVFERGTSSWALNAMFGIALMYILFKGKKKTNKTACKEI